MQGAELSRPVQFLSGFVQICPEMSGKCPRLSEKGPPMAGLCRVLTLLWGCAQAALPSTRSNDPVVKLEAGLAR